MQTKILVVGPSWVGDMVMAQCLFKLIKQKQPHVLIDVLAPAWSLPLLARMPEVSTALSMPIGHGQLSLRARYQLGKKLRANNYAQAIVLPNSFKSALIPWFAGIPKRTGWRGEMRYGVLNDVRVLDKIRYPRMIDRFMALALPANDPLPERDPIPLLQISLETLSATLRRYELSDAKPVLALCPGAEFGPAKQWPEDYYAEVANAKLKEGWQVWIFGSQNDRAVAERINQQTQGRCINLAGKTKLEEAIDLLSIASVVVSNDSGLMHVAAALARPLVAVYGPTSSVFTPPLNANAEIVSLNLECQPCFQRTCPLKHHRCMKELSVAMVLNKVNLLNNH